MPKYGNVNERRNQLHEVIRLSGVNIMIDDNDHPLIIKVASMQPSRIQVYFIESDDFFQKLDSDEDAVGSNRDDSDERAIFYARGTMDTVKKLRWNPTITHVSGLISALLPAFIRQNAISEPAFHESKLVYSVLPGEITGKISPEIFRRLKADGISADLVEKYASHPLNTNLYHLLAIENADGVIFHTPEPDPELLALAQERNIPYITAPEDPKDKAAYSDFYDSLSNED